MRVHSRKSQRKQPAESRYTKTFLRPRRTSEPRPGSSKEPQWGKEWPVPKPDEKWLKNDDSGITDIASAEDSQEEGQCQDEGKIEAVLNTTADKVAMQVKLAWKRRTEAVNLWFLIDTGNLEDEASMIRLTGLYWIEDAYRISKFVMPATMNKSRFRVLILEEDNPEDDELLRLHCTGLQNGDSLKKVTPGNLLTFRSVYDGGPITSANVHLSKDQSVTLIVAKMRKDDAPIDELTRMLTELRRHVVKCFIAMDQEAPDEPRLERISMRLSNSIGVYAGRKMVECMWRDLGIKVDYVVELKTDCRPAPRSSLCHITIDAKARNVLTFQMIYGDLKQRVAPSDHGIEIHKVAHLETGEIRLRIKELVPGGRVSYASDVRAVLGFDSYLT